MFDGVAFFVAVIFLAKIIADYKTRKKLIENGNLSENLKEIWQKHYETKPLQSVKWAMILVGIGAAIFLGQLYAFPFAKIATVGFAFCFSGIAMLVHYFLAKKDSSC